MPQVEDGFTRIANELLEAILLGKFTLQQHRVLLAVIRKTYGYNKKIDDISASQIGAVSGMSRENVTRTLMQLQKMNVITKKDGQYGSIIGIQKNYGKWLFINESPSVRPTHSVSPTLVSDRTVASVSPTQVDSVSLTHTKNNLPKDNKQNKAGKKKTLSEYLDECEMLNQKPIPEDDPIFDYASKAGIPVEYLELNWLEFKNAYTDTLKAKKYIDWKAHFRVSVRGNWYKIWWFDNGNCALGSGGKQAMKVHKGK